MEYRLCPSILSADFNRLGEQIKILEKEGVEYLHIDVIPMNGWKPWTTQYILRQQARRSEYGKTEFNTGMG